MPSPIEPAASPLHDSPYAAALRQEAAAGRFDPKLEAEYERASLLGKRTLIRATAVLAALLAAGRGIEQALAATAPTKMVPVAVIFALSMLLAGIVWSRHFGRWYLPVAQIAVPLRNVVAAVFAARAAAGGHAEMLMILPLMVIGPFFFLGLGYRVSLLTVLLTVAAFLVGAALFGMALPVTIRSAAFLLMGTVVCTIAARHLEATSRTSFLESRLVAELAEHDPLTGLKNRAVFDRHLDERWTRAIAEARVIAILLIDVDHFKPFNDAYGHQAGDQALRRVAQTLRALAAGPLDVVARYGGEEFAVILYDVDGDRAQAAAERMRAAVRDLGIVHSASDAGAEVTISVGVAVVEPSSERQSGGALQLADQALYQAKVRGRNRVEVMDRAAHRLLVTGVFARAAFARR